MAATKLAGYAMADGRQRVDAGLMPGGGSADLEGQSVKTKGALGHRLQGG